MELLRKYKKEVIFIAALIVSGLALLVGVLLFSKEGGQVVVTVSGNEVASFSLDEDRTYLIEGKDGGTNLLIIQDGKAHMESASCPDGLCINMGKIHAAGQSIICLPNEVVVSVEKSQPSADDVDIVVH